MKNLQIHRRFLAVLSIIFILTGGIMAAKVAIDDSFNPQIIGGNVSKVHVQPDGKLIISGNFTQINGTARGGIARLNADGSTDSTFGRVTISSSGVIADSALASDGKIYIAGIFTTVNGVPAKVIARLNADGSLDNSFTADSRFAAADETVAVGIRSDGKVVVSGYFNGIGNSGLNTRVLQLNNNGTVDEGLVSNQFLGESCIFYGCPPKLGPSSFTDLGDSSLLFVGKNFRFQNYANTPAYFEETGMVKSYSSGGVTPVNMTNSAVYGISEAGKSTHNFIYAAGKYRIDPQTMLTTVKKFDLSLNELPFSAPRFRNQTVGGEEYTSSIYPFDNEYVLLSYFFHNLDESENHFLTMLKPNGEQDTSVNLNPNAKISSMVRASADKVYIGGAFTQIAGAARNKLVRIKAQFPTKSDFEGDGKADVAVFRPSNGVWYRLNSSNGQFAASSFGMSGDKPVCADFDGDGKTDTAVFRPSEGMWYVQRSTDNGVSYIPFGIGEDIPVAGDYDGDAKADVAVFRPSTGVWYFLNSSNNQFSAVKFGLSGDVPVKADFDGDSKMDYAVYRPSTGVWWIQKSSGGTTITHFGLTEDIPTANDFDGDGKADIAVFRPSTGDWHRLSSANGQYVPYHFGASGDVPAAADYNGDGKADYAVYRNGVWYLQSSNDGFTAVQFGLAQDAPIPAR